MSAPADSDGAEPGPDVVVIGSGMGGATLAAALAPTGARIVILERGSRLVDSADARDADAIFRRGVYRPSETWLTPDGAPFNPGNYAYVGGNSKFYGAAMLRLRADDFGEIQHLGGVSPAWPITYEDLEPWYAAAEALYEVRGAAGEDPTEPRRSGPYPHAAIADEPAIAAVRRRLAAAGANPASLPLAVDLERWLARAETPWDAHPDTTGAKKDAETVAIARALAHPNVSLWTGAEATRLVAGPDGRIEAVRLRRDGAESALRPRLVVLSAGAVRSAALLLQSADAANPNGLANRSGLVGRRFMNHNCSALLALHPLRRNDAVVQKTLHVNDYYLRGGPDDAPLGNIQLLGKISGTILSATSGLPAPAARWIARRSVDWYVMSEDLPSTDSRVHLRGDAVVMDWRRSNWETHEALVRQAKRLLRRAGFPVLLSQPFDRRTPSHQCGTAVMGRDPDASVLDPLCRAHDHANLYVVDASFFPSSAAVNPALTIAAQALRVADHLSRALAPSARATERAT